MEGTHGATIGELDADTMFYFESRGIDRETAERIMLTPLLKGLSIWLRTAGLQRWLKKPWK